MQLKTKSLSQLQKAVIGKAIGGYGVIDVDNLPKEIERFAGMFDHFFRKTKTLKEGQIDYIDGYLSALYANFDYKKAQKISFRCWDFRTQANVLKEKQSETKQWKARILEHKQLKK